MRYMPQRVEDLPTGASVTHVQIPGPQRADDLMIPMLVAKGSSEGSTLVVLGAVHGDEYEGVLAIQDVFDLLDPMSMSGTVIAIPVTNLPAYRAGTRTTPDDAKNLARVFPGDPDGTITERIAFHVGREVIARADFLLDLHSSGTTLVSPTLVGYFAQPGPVGKLAAAAAAAFGAPVVWEHPTISPGRTLSHASGLGIPALYTEAAGGRRVRAADLEIYTNGVLNVMGVLGMIDRPPGPAPDMRIGGDGNTDAMTAVTTEGLFRPSVGLLQPVEEGQSVGVVRHLDGRVLETVRSPKAGRVAFIRAVPAVVPGDAAVLIADDLSPATPHRRTG